MLSKECHFISHTFSTPYPAAWGEHGLAAACHERGFTLTEVLIGLVMFAFIFLGLSFGMLSTIQTNTQARRLTAAVNLAQDKLEEIYTLDYASIVTGADPRALTETGGISGAGAIYNRSWTVIPGPVANTKLIYVTVTWSDKEGTHQKSLQNIIYQ